MGKWTIESGPHTFSPKTTDEYIDIAYMIRYDLGDGGTFKFLSRQKNDSTGFTRALEMAERIVAAEGMTVDALLAKLDAEEALLEGKLPDLYTRYGQCLFYSPNADPVQKYEIRNILTRKEEIRVFRNTLKQEVERDVRV